MDFDDYVGAFILVSVLIAVGSIIVGFPIMWLWNWLIPSIFGLRIITFWEAVGLSLLSGLLIRSTNTSGNKSK